MGSSTRSTAASPANPLTFLPALNLTLAVKEKAGEPITPPGLPLSKADCASFVSDDCIRVAEDGSLPRSTA